MKISLRPGLSFLTAIVIFLLGSSLVLGQESPPTQPAATFPDLTIPASATPKALSELIDKAKKAKPQTPEQYLAQQRAIRDASTKLAETISDKNSEQYESVQRDIVTSSTNFLVNESAEGAAKSLEKIRGFFENKKKFGTPEIRIAVMAGQSLEQFDDKKLARDTYEFFANTFEASESKEELADMIAMFRSTVRRLELPGKPIELTGKNVQGEEFRIEQWKGKVVLIDYWATWCAPCIESLPKMKAMYAKYHDLGLEVVGISMDNDVEQLKTFLKEKEIPWTTLIDTETPGRHPSADMYGVLAIPTMFLVDREGNVVAVDVESAELETRLRLLFPEPAKQ